jgi:uncharacterized protein
MTSRPHYVLDTNVVVSALLFPDSVPGQAFFFAVQHGEILVSSETIEEVASVLRRKQFERYVPPDERERFLATLIRHAILLEPTKRIRGCRDAGDDKWLEIAIAGNADRIISGDRDLLEMKTFRGIPIVSPAQFVASVA